MAFEITNLAELERQHDRFLAENERAIADALDLAGRHGVEHVQQHPEFKPHTGALQKATSYRIVRMSNGRVLKLDNSSKHADATDTGAKPHVILPRRGRFLRFIGRDGRTVFTRRVNHPGNKPYKFMFFATDAADRAFRQDMSRRMSDLASRF
jgi:hypothetical protein